jgi:hypothetical protein
MPYNWIWGPFWAGGGGGETNTAPWTYDANIPPSSVYGLSSLNYYSGGGSASAAAIGFLSYVTQDPDTGVPSENVISQMGGNIYGDGSLAPCFLDENVIVVTIACNCFADGGVAAMGSCTLFIGLE